MAEAAGLVMAAFPLIIEGLHLYVKGIESIKKWWNYVKTLKRLIRKLEMEQTRLENSCTELLHDIVDEEVLPLLLEKPGGYRWREQSLHQALRLRLDKSFAAYMDAIEDMRETVDYFKDILDLDSNNKPKWIDYKAHKREWKRVHFCLCEDRVDGLLGNLQKDNKDLAVLLGHSQRMEATRLSKGTANARRYERVRDHARNLYRALKHTFSWPCGCAIPHNASLRLEYRSSPGPAMTGANSDTWFNVLFFFEIEESTVQPPWIWRDTLIQPTIKSDCEANVQVPASAGDPRIAAATSFASSAATRANTSAILAATGISFTAIGGHSCISTFDVEAATTASRPLIRSKKVSFAPQVGPSAAMPPHDRSAPSLTPVLPSERIEYLCGAMLNTAESECLGILVDDIDRCHRVSVTRTSNGPDPMQTISLKALLMEAALEKKDRLILGLKLASTLLQLHSTHWLCETWTKHDIFFTKQSEAGPVVLDKPFVSKHFHSPTCTVQAAPMNNELPRSLKVRNQSLFALGIILIELWYGKSLESLRINADMDTNQEANAITNFATAIRLIDNIYNDANEWYGDAVRRCIRFDFDSRHNGLDKDLLKEAVHIGVVKPLEDNLGAFCGGKLKDILV